MAKASGSTRSLGRFGSLVLTIGLISFFGGLFFFPRAFVLIGVGLLVLAVALFWIEETGYRRLHRTSWR